jgi:uncharacterized protein
LASAPALIFGLPYLGIVGPDVTKIATATSLALVIPTSIASAQAHAAKGAVDRKAWLLLAPTIVAGAFITSSLAFAIDARIIIVLFVAYALIFAAGLLQRSEPSTKKERGRRSLRDMAEIAVKTTSGAGLASLLGMGGGFFCVPILSRIAPLPVAIGTSSALGLPLAASGVVGYLLGPIPPGCDHNCAGAIYVPAVAAIGMTSVLTAPIGAKLAHLLPVMALKRMFAAMLLLTAADLIHKEMPSFSINMPSPSLIAGLLRGPVCLASARQGLVQNKALAHN